jgi:hypothetical protein
MSPGDVPILSCITCGVLIGLMLASNIILVRAVLRPRSTDLVILVAVPVMPSLRSSLRVHDEHPVARTPASWDIRSPDGVPFMRR